MGRRQHTVLINSDLKGTSGAITEVESSSNWATIAGMCHDLCYRMRRVERTLSRFDVAPHALVTVSVAVDIVVLSFRHIVALLVKPTILATSLFRLRVGICDRIDAPQFSVPR